MNDPAKGSFFPAEIGPGMNSVCADYAHTWAGTFSLRRAHYFSESALPVLSAEKRKGTTNPVSKAAPETKLGG